MSTNALRLAALFGDHMVLQRGIKLPVWGWAKPGDAITVTVAGKTARAVARADGTWKARLPVLAAGGPHELKVNGRKSGQVVRRDVMVGEVWVASGQSNMQFGLNAADNAEQEIAAADWPNMRLYSVAQKAVVEQPKDSEGVWEVCSPKSAELFSAVAYHFGRDIHRELGIPVGLINASVGGTPAEAWTSREALMANPSLRPIVENYEKLLPDFDRLFAEYQAKMADGVTYPVDPGNTGFSRGWADPATDASKWEIMDVPRMWQQAGLNFSGVVWFRREVDVPADWAGKDLVLHLAPCDKHDTTYFNNVVVGGMGKERPDAWSVPRVYTVPGHLVKPGRNVIAVRIYSFAWAGGFMGSKSSMRLEPPADLPSAAPIALWGPWQYQVEHNFGVVIPARFAQPPGPGNGNSPYSLYRGMIAPLVPYGIRGAIWYQGESNADRAYQYRTLFATMIRGWRKAWGRNIEFLFVQLANYMAANSAPGESAWAELREAQTRTLKLPRTGMAVAIDIGDAADIHPKNKAEVGRRLALWALSRTYGKKKTVQSGPLFESTKVEKGRVCIRFRHAADGLVAKGGALAGFAIAGADRKFVWAETEIVASPKTNRVKNAVLLWSPSVKKPVAVRYGWADNPECNLYNTAGLPASPFRTDDWPGLTWPKKN